MEEKRYFCIDLKSFYASVECVERGLDPMTAMLAVADPERGEKTICLAITPAMKALGIRNRCRVFEIPKNISYITAPPRMKLYIQYAAKIYGIYLDYFSKDDIHVYSIDEVFVDATPYLTLYRTTDRELAKKVMEDIYRRTGIRATCGIGTNLYLTKIALDITAKHAPDFIGFLDEKRYRETLWQHRPLTDFWRIGKGLSARLHNLGLDTMETIARADEEFLYRQFGVDAELLIDHAWGREPVTIADIKAYRSRTNCLTNGQVLMRDYPFEDGRLIVKEMMDVLCLEMTDRNLVTDSVTLQIGYANGLSRKPAHGTFKVARKTNSDRVLVPEAAALYTQIVDPAFPIRRVTVTCNQVTEEKSVQYSLLEDVTAQEDRKKLRQEVVKLQKKYGKNAVLKGMNLEKNATTRDRNGQIGGHKSGED